MGFSISWIGVEGLEPGGVLEALGLIETDAVDPDNRARYACARLPGGRLIIYSNDFDYVTPQRLAVASAQGLAIGCKVEEHVMVSEAYGFRDGAEIWAVSHNLERGVYDLAVTGRPPAEFPAVRDRHFHLQDKAEPEVIGESEPFVVDHLFDAPVELANVLFGYRHDQTEFDWGRPTFRMLKRTARAERSPPVEKTSFMYRLGALLSGRRTRSV